MKTNPSLVGAAFLHEELARMNNFGTESSSGYMIILMNEMLENLVTGSDSLYRKVDAMVQENRVRFDSCSSEASGKEELPDLRASSSNHVARKSSVKPSGSKHSGKGKVLMDSEEVKQIDKRLKGVEEGGEAMKQAFWESMVERKKLMNEIYHQLQAIHHCPHQGGEFSDRALIINSHEDERSGTGLSQVLCQQSNPSSLVIRHVRAAATMVALKEPAKLTIHEFSPRIWEPSLLDL